MNQAEFTELLWQRGKELYRDMPWRQDTRPYYVLVSELMLQQTQVSRVMPKFEAFVARFPDIQTLAVASLADVLRLWQGLGYNRRAKFLHDSAKFITAECGGVFPDTYNHLLQLPGVGPNTAGAILAYAYNQPAEFIETNVRTVYIHHFFQDADTISDSEIGQVLAQTLNHEHVREFYWALMDYGAWLKTQGVRTNARSKHYAKQSPLKGSIREVRGQIVNRLRSSSLSRAELEKQLQADDRFDRALGSLVQDGLIYEHDGKIDLTR